MDKKQQAQRLYMAGGYTQKEIAETVSVSERTIHTWIHQCAWDKLRLAAYQAPATIADNLCSQLVELQNAIASREPGKRYATPGEAEVMRKLIVSLEKMKKYPSLSQNMQILETFRNYIRPVDKKFATQLSNYTERFLNGKSVNGFAPYQMEYGVDPVSPISSFYEETIEEENSTEAPKEATPCPNIDTCLHPGHCSYPKCRHPEWYNKVDPSTRYSIPSLHYQHQRSEVTGSDSAVFISENAQIKIVRPPEAA
jgi:DNA-binding XRE family transcriptional regulator